jgi:Ca2+-binding RTX toxin-like protein
MALSLAAGGLVAGCSGNSPWSVDPDGYDGIGQQTFAVLTQPCVIDNTAHTMALEIGDSETLYLTMRAADNKVIADAVTGGGGECAVPSTYAINVIEDALNPGTNEKVFLDYINGSFALGSTTAGVATPGITLSVGSGTLLVRGSSSADKFNLGSTFSGAALQFNWMNVNGDTSPDLRMNGVTDIVVTTGPGNDTVSADGGNGTSGLPLDATIQFSAFGGIGDDTLTGGASAVGAQSLLNGGAGDDKFVQTATVGADLIVGGTGFDTVDYSVRTAAVSVTVCTGAGCAVPNDGDVAANEQDTVNDDVEIVLGGKGDDTIDASAAVCSNGGSPATIKCTLKGNEGNDTLIGSGVVDLLDGGAGDDTLQGGLGSDTFVGGAGVDTVSYADRGTTVKVSLDATKLWVAFQNGAAGELDVIGTDVENLTGGGGDDSLRGNASANIIHGGAGIDTIEGGAGNDTLYGDLGADKLYGGAGNDMLVGGNGQDLLIGGDGDDFIDAVEASGAAAKDSASAVIDCDGVNDFAGTAGTAPGTNDTLIGEGVDTNQNCDF